MSGCIKEGAWSEQGTERGVCRESGREVERERKRKRGSENRNNHQWVSFLKRGLFSEQN